MEIDIDINESQESFKSSENSQSSSISGKITKKNTIKQKKDAKSQGQLSKKDKKSLPRKSQPKNKLPIVNIEQILYNQRSITRLMKNIFKRILDINCTNQSYELFLEKLSPTDFKFYDNQFPPNLNSLIKGCKNSQTQNTNIYSVYQPFYHL